MLRLLSAALVTAVTCSGCTDDLPALPDSRVSDSGGVRDASTVDQAQTRDLPLPTDAGMPPDAGRPLDGPLPIDAGQAPDVGNTNLCNADGDCTVFEDCCSCRAELKWVTPASCKMACSANKCEQWNLAKPVAYCVAGRCEVTSGSGCNAAGQCQVVNNCCMCNVWPASLPVPSCSITCVVDACTAEGLKNPKAICAGGLCRLTL